MPLEIQQTMDTCVDHLTATEGGDLQIMANISNPSQMNAVMEGHLYAFLGSRYIPGRTELLLRLTVSYQGRGREDLVTIAKSGGAAKGFGDPDDKDGDGER